MINKCKVCSMDFEWDKQYPKLTCSVECRKKQRSLCQIGEKNASWKDNKLINKDVFVYKYEKLGYSIERLAREYNTSKHTIHYNISYYDLERRCWVEQIKLSSKQRVYRGLSGKDNPAYIHGKHVGLKRNRAKYLYVAKQKDWLCEKCGATKTNNSFDLIVHHKDNNHFNNNINNLQILCQSCHFKTHLSENISKGKTKKCIVCSKMFTRWHTAKYCSDYCKKNKKLRFVKIESIKRTNVKKQMYDLQVPDYHNFLLGSGIITHNSGKTFSLRSFIDRAIQSGQHCVILNDVKDEFKSSIKPVQGKFRHLLLPNEKPKGFKVVTLRPTFFKKLLPEDMVDSEKDKYGLERYADNYWYSPDINDMRETEFMTLFNVETMTPIQQSVMEDFFEMLREKRKDNFDFQMFFDILENMDITEGTKQSLRNRLKPILRSYFYQEKWQRSVTHLLENGFVPALNFEQFDSFSNTGLAYPQAVMFMVMREVVEYMRRPKRKIKRLWGIIDEGARFFGNSELNKLSTYLSDSYELDRRYGVSYFFATQNYTTVPERIVKGSRYMLLPGRADVDTFKTVMRDFGCFRYQNQLTQEAKRLKDKVNANKHEWALFDRDGVGTDKVRVFVPLAPLSHHLETGK